MDKEKHMQVYNPPNICKKCGGYRVRWRCDVNECECLEKEAKKRKFLEKARKNIANDILHKELIEKHFSHREEISDTFYLALMEYAEEYKNRAV